MKNLLLSAITVLGLIALPVHAQNLLDGDFSTNPGSGSPAPSTALGTGTWQYLLSATAGATATNVGGAGAWTFYDGTGANLGADNVKDTLTADPTVMTWIPPASANNTGGYVVQLDSIAHGSDAGDPATTGFTTGNALSQTVSVKAGQLYTLTFAINTETGAGKAGTSYADVMITNANIVNAGGNSGTILTTNTSNKNALTYGDVTGLQYSVTTTGNGGTATNWATYTLTFTGASTGNTTIYFADDTNNDIGNSNVALEDFSLTTVPEPRDWALIILLAIGGLVAVRKLRNGGFLGRSLSAS